MNQKKKLLLGILGLVLVIGLAAVMYRVLGSNYETESLVTQATTAPTETTVPGETQQETEPTEPPAAPDFKMFDADLNEYHLSDFVGKPIVLNFWASWCGPCRSEMPDFNAAYLEQGEEVQFLMVNMTDGFRETLDSARDHVTEAGYSFPVFYDVESDAAVTYGVNSMPTTYFIDSEGVLIARAMGAIDAETLQKGIDMITE